LPVVEYKHVQFLANVNSHSRSLAK